MALPIVTTSFTTIPNGIRVFARTAGPKNGANVLLLHGFPFSSNQFRNMIPILAAAGYRVTAPDLPGFGFTEIPTDLDFKYTFANIAATISAFLDVADIKEFAVYTFDYGAPTGLRLMLERPDAVKAIISQNGNAYVEGLLPFWDPLKQLWASKPGSEQEKTLRQLIGEAVLNFAATKSQYTVGETHPELIDPASWTLDAALLERPGNKDIQLDLFRDYATNVDLYPAFQEHFRKSQIPVLAVWGKNDIIFGYAAAEAFKRDVKNAEVELWDAGHFMSETQTVKLAERMIKFLGGIGMQGVPK